MATNKLSKPRRTVSISDESYDESEPMMTTNENEFKPIPFLRRLVDMLRENDEVISFYPGEVKKGGKVTLGRILVHDRIKVEADILPRYFNHSSFASLRRQLNYFCFTRLGKGRQRGATYCNEGVVVLDDILRLKRRSTTVGAAREAAAAAAAAQQQQTMLSQAATRKAGGHSRSVSDSSISTTTEESSTPSSSSAKKRLSNSNKHNSSPPTLISPRSSPIHTSGGGDNSVPQITLDLTIPPPTPHRIGESPSSCCASSYATLDDYYNIGNTPVVVGARCTAATSDHDDSDDDDDADLLAGCKALLSIRSLGPEDLAAAF